MPTTRSFALALAASVMLLLVAPAASAQGATMPLPPLQPGDTWSYETVQNVPGGDTTTATMTITVDEAGDMIVKTVEAHGGARAGESRSVWYDADDFAKTQVESSGPGGTATYSIDPPCAEWQFPMTPGMAWTTSCSFYDGSESFTIDSSWSVVREESVTVPAGTYDTVVLEQTGEGFVERWWFAPAACWYVKHESLDGEGNVLASEAAASVTCAHPPMDEAEPPATTPTTTTPASATPVTTPTTSPTGATPSATTATPPTATTRADEPDPADTPGAGTLAVTIALVAAALVAARRRG